MLGIFKNRKKDVVKEEAKAVEIKVVKDLDELLDKIMEDLYEDGTLGTILELRFFGTKEGIEISVGGSNLAKRAFCDMGEGYEQVYDDTKEKLTQVANELRDALEKVSGKKAESRGEEGKQIWQ